MSITPLTSNLVSVPIMDVPVIPLRNRVVYPNTLIPIDFMGETAPLRVLNHLTKEKQQVLLITQKPDIEEIQGMEDLYSVGTLVDILQVKLLSNHGAKIWVKGKQRCTLTSLHKKKYWIGSVIPFPPLPLEDRQSEKIQVLIGTVLKQFKEYLHLQGDNSLDIFLSLLADFEDRDQLDPEQLSDMIAMQVTLKTHEKQTLLELFDITPRLDKLLVLLEEKIRLLKSQNSIRQRIQDGMADTQKKFYLREQMKAIQEELAESDGALQENEKLAIAIQKAKMPKETHQKAMDELKKLEMMPSISAEATVSRNYIDSLLNLPWQKRTKTNFTLDKAEAILNTAHYGLEKVKEHILEFLAVLKRIKKPKGSILCFVGPPGVGKTSLGHSIAKAMGLKFVRVSLGGVRDEAEIRGHRRTYIGAMPGQVIQQITKVKNKNPLFMLDEIDKMAMDFRGDPASALLEVLDPEHNHSFTDHYLEVPFDLSEVFFVATANEIQHIPPALLDRMEVIQLSGYTEEEKINIVEQYLLPKQMTAHGVSKEELTVQYEALLDMVRYYTLEAGVRNLERETAKLCRKVVMQLSKQKTASPIIITADNLENYLGTKRFRYGKVDLTDQVGEVNGLAWTAARGELLKIESAVMPGKGKISYTGQLGEVMQESIQTAFNVVKVRSKQLGIDKAYYDTIDIHIHVPEGATPKDGPSAGIGMCTALLSSITNRAVRADVAMTGEVTLLGKVLPIGGLKEKLLAALQGGIRLAIIPKDNERDLKDIPSNVTEKLDIRLVESIEEVFALAFRSNPQNQSETPSTTVESSIITEQVVAST